MARSGCIVLMGFTALLIYGCPRDEDQWARLKSVAYATPLKELPDKVEKIAGFAGGLYLVGRDAYVIASEHNPKNREYSKDPNAPLVVMVMWAQCKEAAIHAFGGESPFPGCSKTVKPTATLLPLNSGGNNYASLTKALSQGGKTQYLVQTVLNSSNNFIKSILLDNNQRYRYYFNSEKPESSDLPYAIDYLLDN